MITINNVRMDYPLPKRYIEYIRQPFTRPKSVTALHDINLQVNPGDRVAFLGANGAGKTTLLKLIGGILYPGTGNIVVGGYDTMKDQVAARRMVGFVLNEERSFYWRLTGRENLQFFGTLDNLAGQQLKDRAQHLIATVGLEEAANRRFGEYSSGMKQRLAIARGLLCRPKILILDEPTRTLDPIASDKIKELLLDTIHHEQKDLTLLIATHSMEEAESLCNRVCVMKKGKVIAYRELADIKSEYGSLRSFYLSIMN